MRIRTRRRRLQLLMKLVPTIIFIVSIFFFVRSWSAKDIKPISYTHKPTIYIVEDENDAFNIWKNVTKTYDISHISGTLIGVNSHCNDGLFIPLRRNISHVISVQDGLNQLFAMPLQAVYPAVIGIFSQTMCVYPWWRHSNDIYVHKKHYMGLWEESLCFCTSGTNGTFNETSCSIVSGDLIKSVNVSDCVQFGEQWEMSIMEDIYAQTGFKDVSGTVPTLLSIDLDFFTIDQPVNLPDRVTVDLINSQIRALLCPRSVQEEVSIDAWFQELLRVTEIALSAHIVRLMGLHQLSYCSHKEFINKSRLRALFSTIERFSDIERRQLSLFGLCISSQSIAHLESDFLSAEICAGLSVSRNTHDALDDEISLQMEKLSQFLKQSVSRPHTITIARSTRLGLVSPKSQGTLEALLLSQLTSLYNTKETDVVYHPNLLGGPQGHSGRQVYFHRSS